MMNTNAPNADVKADMKTVFTIVDRKGKSYWQRIGVAFVNSDKSLTLKLDAIPINGTMQVRDSEPYEKRADHDRGRSAATSSQTAA